MSSNNEVLSEADRQTLLALAPASIRTGLGGERLLVEPDRYSFPLQERRATFVTLNLHGRLRGCIGTLEARQALVLDVVANAHAAAFQDPRFPAVTRDEFDALEIHISLLSQPEPVVFESEQDLIGCLRPGVDGLILQEGTRRGTFLPSVWESLPDPHDFLRHLKHKAGLPADYWSQHISIQRYVTEAIP